MTETQPGQPFLAFRDVSVTYTNGSGPIAVFGPTTFDVGPGEFLAVVGPTGCGKTTLLRVPGALLRPTEGKVTHQGQEVAEQRWATAALRVPSRVTERVFRVPYRINSLEIRRRHFTSRARLRLAASTKSSPLGRNA